MVSPRACEILDNAVMTSQSNKTDVTAVILAGGRGSRMLGLDKGLLQYGEKLFYQHLADALTEQCDRVIINANRNLDQYKSYGLDVIPDPLNDFQGPLAGILAGLRACETTWLVTVPCDGPFIDEQYVKIMKSAIATSQSQCGVAFDGERQQPVYLMLEKSLTQSLENYLSEGQRKIDRWYKNLSYTEVDFAGRDKMFFNVNTPEQLQSLS